MLAVAVVLLAGYAVAQQTAPTDHRADVPFFAVDSHNDLIRHLTAAEFTFWDGKTELTSGVTVQSGSELPLRLGVLVDTSTKAHGDAYAAALHAISNFVQGAMLEQNVRVFFVPFANKTDMSAFMSKDDLAHYQLKISKGDGAALYDAIVGACKERMAVEETHPARRVLVVISNGEDNQSRFTYQQAIAAAQSAGVVIFTVNTGSGGSGDHGEVRLREFSDQTGGIIFPGSNPGTISRPFEAISDQIHSMYVASYAPADPANAHLTVKAKSEKTVKVRQARR